ARTVSSKQALYPRSVGSREVDASEDAHLVGDRRLAEGQGRVRLVVVVAGPGDVCSAGDGERGIEDLGRRLAPGVGLIEHGAVVELRREMNTTLVHVARSLEELDVIVD